MIRAAVVGAILLLSTPCAAQPDAVGRLLERAESLEERGRQRQAWRMRMRASERAEPDDPRAAVALGRMLPVAGPIEPPWDERAADVEAKLGRYIESVNRPDAEARRLHAWARALSGELSDGIARAIAAIGLQDRAGADGLRALAALAVAQEDLAAARTALEAAVRAFPQDNDILGDLGAVELAMGRPDDAAERFARILGRQPTDLAARRDLAGALVAAGRPDAALELLRAALRAHPDDADLRLETSYAALEAGAPQTAQTAAEAAIAHLEPNDPRGHVALGAALAAQRRRAPAIAAYREALRRAPNDARARRGLDALEQDGS